MSQNINQTVALIAVAQATAQDVSIASGQMFILGADPINIARVNRTEIIAATGGNPIVTTITFATAVATGVVYSGTITQTVSGKIYSYTFNYEVPNPAGTDAANYAAILALIQAGIDGNQIIGTVTGGVTNVVFTPSIEAPVSDLNLSATLSKATASAVTVTAAGSSFSAGVLTSGAATGATTGELYIISFTGVTGTDAARVNDLSFVAKALSGTTFYIYGLDPASTLTTTIGTMTVRNDGANTLENIAFNVYGANAGVLGASQFNPAHANFGVIIGYEQVGDIEEGANIPLVVLIDGTSSANANANALFRAILNGLNGSTPANALNTVQPV